MRLDVFNSEFLNESAAARRLGISRSELGALVRRGRLQVRVGGTVYQVLRVRVPKNPDDVEAFLESRR